MSRDEALRQRVPAPRRWLNAAALKGSTWTALSRSCIPSMPRFDIDHFVAGIGRRACRP